MNDDNMITRLYGKKTIALLDKRIKLLSNNKKIKAREFLKIRLISSVVIFIILLFLGLLSAPIIAILYYYFFDKVLIDNKIKARRVKLEQEAVQFFEVLTLSLETGRNLEEAIIVTINSVDSDLSREFKEALREVKFGKTLNESLVSMQERIPSDSINNIILVLTEANMFGNSIIENMQSQVDYLREKRKLEIKAEISKVPIKISVVSVLFFVPLILLIILGPALLTFMGM